MDKNFLNRRIKESRGYTYAILLVELFINLLRYISSISQNICSNHYVIKLHDLLSAGQAAESVIKYLASKFVGFTLENKFFTLGKPNSAKVSKCMLAFQAF